MLTHPVDRGAKRAIHILALYETKFDALYTKELTHIPDYQQVCHDRSCTEDGVSIYIRDSIAF